ncbi:hypothetical protein AAFN89_11380 [Inquilinus sp. CAU 1745]
MELVSRTVFGLASIALMLLAGGLMVFAGSQVLHAFRVPEMSVGSTLLDAVGYTIIAIAVFDVAKYLLEEEAVRGREMRRTGEARRSMTKFISTIAIAVFLEALVSVFQASKEDMRMMLYPTLLLFGGVALVVGLGVYQRLSAGAEREMGGPQEEARAEEQEKKENDEESPMKKRPSRRAKSA